MSGLMLNRVTHTYTVVSEGLTTFRDRLGDAAAPRI